MAKLHKENGKLILTDFQTTVANEMALEVGEVFDVNVEMVDKRKISDQQRKFIFALCNEISYYTGDDSEWIRMLMQQLNANLREIEVRSLSNCSMTYANGLIDTIINFCIEQEIPIMADTLHKNEYSFDERQVYMMTLKRICIICGQRADIHHVDAIGMGANRHKVSHIGMRALPLCRTHHIEIHTVGDERYIQRHHLTPIIIDEKMEMFIKKGKIQLHRDDKERLIDNSKSTEDTITPES